MDLLTWILFLLGIAALLGGAEVLVRGASRLAAVFRISPLVVGLTIVALGTSAPELAVTLLSAAKGESGIAIGNIIGSNIFNVLLVLGIVAVVSPVAVSKQLVRVDVPLMAGASVLVFVLAMDGHLGRLDGAVLFLCLVAYNIYSVRTGRMPEVAIEASPWDGERTPGAGGRDEEGRSRAKRPRRRARLRDFAMVVGGLAGLLLGAHWLVAGAVAVATWAGLSTLIIGLTVVTVGTSLPEVAVSVVATLRGERDMAAGNVVGSNLFNLLGVLGLGALLLRGGIAVPVQAVTFDLPVMVAVALACVPVFITQGEVSRWEGGLFLAYYLIYTLYLILASTHHDAITAFSAATCLFALPVTAVLIVVSIVRHFRDRPRGPGVADESGPKPLKERVR